MNNINNKDFKDLVNIDVDKIIEYLTCKLCKGIFKEPHTITDCNHSFCKSSKNKETICPICKKYLGSKPREIIIGDLGLERFVEIIFPEFKTLDEKEEKYIYTVCRENNCPLPDDVEFKKNEDIILILLPFKSVRPDLILPAIQISQIKVTLFITIDALKKYIKNKLDMNIESHDQIEILYRNQVMKNELKVNNIIDIYGRSVEDYQIIFYYHKKE